MYTYINKCIHNHTLTLHTITHKHIQKHTHITYTHSSHTCIHSRTRMHTINLNTHIHKYTHINLHAWNIHNHKEMKTHTWEESTAMEGLPATMVELMEDDCGSPEDNGKERVSSRSPAESGLRRRIPEGECHPWEAYAWPGD